MASVPGIVEGLTSTESDGESVLLKVSRELQERDRSADLVQQMIELGERAEALEPNSDLRTRISMAVSLLRDGPNDS